MFDYRICCIWHFLIFDFFFWQGAIAAGKSSGLCGNMCSRTIRWNEQNHSVQHNGLHVCFDYILYKQFEGTSRTFVIDFDLR